MLLYVNQVGRGTLAMRYKYLLRFFTLSILLGWSACSFAEQCPDTSQPLPTGWSVFQGQITGYDKFAQAIIITGTMISANCVYNNYTQTPLILTKGGGFKPFPADYWAPCPNLDFAQCCIQSIGACTFVQTSLHPKKQ